MAAVKREKIEELDLLRALAAFFVIVIHVTAAPLVLGARGSVYHYAITLVNQLARFSIPAFIFVTGLVLFYNYPNHREIKWSGYFRKRITYVLVPYIFWSAIYFYLKQFMAHRQLNLPETALQFVGALLRGDSYYHLYFVVLIFQFYLLFPLLLPLWQWARQRIGLVTAALFALYSGYIYLSFYNIKPFDSSIINFIFKYQGKLFLAWFGFFVLGAYSALRLDQVRQLITRWAYPAMLGAGALLVGMVGEFYWRTANPRVDVAYAATSLRPLGIAFTVVAIVAVLAAARKFVLGRGLVSQITTSLSNHSYGIYLIHPLVLTFLEIVEYKLGLGYPWWLVAANLTLCFSCSYLAAAILGRFTWARPLIGR